MPPVLLSRRLVLQGLLGGAVAPFAPRAVSHAATLPDIVAYRNPGCGCCGKWANSLQKAGFNVTMFDDADLDQRRSREGVPADLAGCHTAYVGDYIIEGHVPAEDIIRLLEEKPQARGLAVAGMPLGSPGMEADGAKDAYNVMLFMADGTSRIYASY